jgi:hypothetical protein
VLSVQRSGDTAAGCLPVSGAIAAWAFDLATAVAMGAVGCDHGQRDFGAAAIATRTGDRSASAASGQLLDIGGEDSSFGVDDATPATGGRWDSEEVGFPVLGRVRCASCGAPRTACGSKEGASRYRLAGPN